MLQEKSKDLAKRMILHWNYSYAIALGPGPYRCLIPSFQRRADR